MFKKKKIGSVPELEKELKGVYDRTEPSIIQNYLSAAIADTENPPKTHRVTGCCDCPFIRSVSNGEGFIHTFCIWDGTKNDISQFVEETAVTPVQCPLKNSAIRVEIKTTENGNKE